MEDWKFSLTPYLWFPNVGSTAQFTLPSGIGGGGATVEKGADYSQDRGSRGASGRDDPARAFIHCVVRRSSVTSCCQQISVLS